MALHLTPAGLSAAVRSPCAPASAASVGVAASSDQRPFSIDTVVKLGYRPVNSDVWDGAVRDDVENAQRKRVPSAMKASISGDVGRG